MLVHELWPDVRGRPTQKSESPEELVALVQEVAQNLARGPTNVEVRTDNHVWNVEKSSADMVEQHGVELDKRLNKRLRRYKLSRAAAGTVGLIGAVGIAVTAPTWWGWLLLLPLALAIGGVAFFAGVGLKFLAGCLEQLISKVVEAEQQRFYEAKVTAQYEVLRDLRRELNDENSEGRISVTEEQA